MSQLKKRQCVSFRLEFNNHHSISAIIVIVTIMVFCGRISHSSDLYWPLQEETDREIHLVGKSPKVGETFEVIYRIRLKPDIQAGYGKRNFYVIFSATSMYPYGSMEVVGPEEVCIPCLVPGQWHEVKAKYRIPELTKIVQISATLGTSSGHNYKMAGAILRLYLLDSLTGQYGTKKKSVAMLPVEYRYDPVDGSFTCSPSQNQAPVEENCRLIKTIRQLEPALSDSEALLLHSDQYRIGVPEGLPRWDENNNRWLDEEIFEYYLKDGWYRALREGRREEWIQNERNKVQQMRKGGF